MPLDDYASAVGGGLKLKGAKVTKPKKKKRRDKTDLEKNLETGDQGSSTALVKHREESAGDLKLKSKKKSEDPEEDRDNDDDDEGSGRVVQKTEAERRYEERKRKRRYSDILYQIQLLELAESSSSRPELLKTHKERVEELNTYLSKLSEHHDMPKIGPG
ncbi:hypothetical protein CLIM01_03268 [Colletotrichum limetticola]|uniref:Uncharacterized protein n=1 Tax=Colletotrichum limetticola TaxID=1209924 RepID=A0ABQ9Q6C2_9PEZI|nr:hypothetical protein CLIM01_03268 [Colletotrichum limetticola]